MSNSIIELLYFDSDRVASLLSQFEDGLIDNIEIQTSKQGNKKSSLEAGPSFLKGKAEDIEDISNSNNLVKFDFHNIIKRILDHLNNCNFLLSSNDLSSFLNIEYREKMALGKYIHYRGNCSIYDYTKLKSMTENYSELTDIIAYCASQNLIKMANPNGQLSKTKEKEILKRTKQTLGMDQINDQYIDKISKFINMIYPDHIMCRFSDKLVDIPYLECRLKRSCFLDENNDYILAAYGSNPNVELEIIGSITSLPEPTTNLTTQTLRNSGDTDYENYDSAFQQMFSAIEELENTMKGVHFPNFRVYPLLIFRNIESTS